MSDEKRPVASAADSGGGTSKAEPGETSSRPGAGGERPEPKPEAEGSAAAAAGAAAAGTPGWRVQLPTFEGPLDLLLHLIQQHELDILDIPIGFVTEKYVEYVTLMQELNIDIASEYLVMAATLVHIKSKMLLPSAPDEQEEGEEEEADPRAELVRRLLEYQKYKQVAEELSERSLLGRDVFVRGAPAPSVDGPTPLAPVSLFKLIDAFQGVLDRAKITVDHEIDYERFSITDRIHELSSLLAAKRRLRFEELFEGVASRGQLVVTFLALLEMTRLRMTRLSQADAYEPIFVELAVSEDDDGEAEWGAEPPAGDHPAASAEAEPGAEGAEPSTHAEPGAEAAEPSAEAEPGAEAEPREEAEPRAEAEPSAPAGATEEDGESAQARRSGSDEMDPE